MRPKCESRMVGGAVYGEALVFLMKGNGCGCPALPLHPIQNADLGSNSHFIALRKHIKKTRAGTEGQKVCESLITPLSHCASLDHPSWCLFYTGQMCLSPSRLPALTVIKHSPYM